MEAGRTGWGWRRQGKGRGRREYAADVFDLLEELTGGRDRGDAGGEDERLDGPGFAEIDCPNCGDVVCLAEEVFDGDRPPEAICPNCGEVLYTEDK